jgi:hypothetical protein
LILYSSNKIFDNETISIVLNNPHLKLYKNV